MIGELRRIGTLVVCLRLPVANDHRRSCSPTCTEISTFPCTVKGAKRDGAHFAGYVGTCRGTASSGGEKDVMRRASRPTRLRSGGWSWPSC